MRSINQLINEINQSIVKLQSINEPINQQNNQSITHSLVQLSTQLINHLFPRFNKHIETVSDCKRTFK